MEPTSSPDNNRSSRGLSRFWPVHRDAGDPADTAEQPEISVARPGETQMVALGSRRADLSRPGATDPFGPPTGGPEPDGTLSGGTLSGGTLSGGTQSGGTLSGGTLSGGTLSGGTLSGGTHAAPVHGNPIPLHSSQPGGLAPASP